MAVAQQVIEEAKELARQGNSQAAITLLSKLLQRDASNVDAWFALSEVVEDPESAEYCLRKVLNLDPGNAAALETLSKMKSGSLSVGSVDGLNHDDRLSEEEAAPEPRTKAQQDMEIIGEDRATPEIPQASTVEPVQQAAVPLWQFTPEASTAAAAEPKESQEKEAQLEAVPAVPEEPAQGLARRFSIGRTDMILIGLTLLAGIVLCALVAVALI